MVHISRAKMVCKMYTPVYLFDGCSNEFKHHHFMRQKSYFLNTIKQVNFVFFLCLLNSFHCKKNFFQNKGFHFYYCSYCSGCLNGMTEENIQAHLNTVASIHQNSFAVNVEWSVKISCGACTSFYFQFKLILFIQNKILKNNYSHCFFRCMKHLTIPSHPYLQGETMRKWSKGMMK